MEHCFTASVSTHQLALSELKMSCFGPTHAPRCTLHQLHYQLLKAVSCQMSNSSSTSWTRDWYTRCWKLTFAHPVYIYRIRVKVVYEGHWVKVTAVSGVTKVGVTLCFSDRALKRSSSHHSLPVSVPVQYSWLIRPQIINLIWVSPLCGGPPVCRTDSSKEGHNCLFMHWSTSVCSFHWYSPDGAVGGRALD